MKLCTWKVNPNADYSGVEFVLLEQTGDREEAANTPNGLGFIHFNQEIKTEREALDALFLSRIKGLDAQIAQLNKEKMDTIDAYWKALRKIQNGQVG